MSQTNDTKQIRIQSRVDSEQNWISNNPELLDREIGYTTDGRYKIGKALEDGTLLRWNELEYASSGNLNLENGEGENSLQQKTNIATGPNSIAIGQYNHPRGGTCLFMVGNGENDKDRKNAMEIGYNGDMSCQGDVYVGSTTSQEKRNKLTTKEYVDNLTYQTTTAETKLMPISLKAVTTGEGYDHNGDTVPNTIKDNSIGGAYGGDYSITFQGYVEIDALTVNGVSICIDDNLPIECSNNSPFVYKGYVNKEIRIGTGIGGELVFNSFLGQRGVTGCMSIPDKYKLDNLLKDYEVIYEGYEKANTTKSFEISEEGLYRLELKFDDFNTIDIDNPLATFGNIKIYDSIHYEYYLKKQNYNLVLNYDCHVTLIKILNNNIMLNKVIRHDLSTPISLSLLDYKPKVINSSYGCIINIAQDNSINWVGELIFDMMPLNKKYKIKISSKQNYEQYLHITINGITINKQITSLNNFIYEGIIYEPIMLYGTVAEEFVFEEFSYNEIYEFKNVNEYKRKEKPVSTLNISNNNGDILLLTISEEVANFTLKTNQSYSKDTPISFDLLESVLTNTSFREALASNRIWPGDIVLFEYDSANKAGTLKYNLCSIEKPNLIDGYNNCQLIITPQGADIKSGTILQCIM